MLLLLSLFQIKVFASKLLLVSALVDRLALLEHYLLRGNLLHLLAAQLVDLIDVVLTRVTCVVTSVHGSLGASIFDSWAKRFLFKSATILAVLKWRALSKATLPLLLLLSSV